DKDIPSVILGHEKETFLHKFFQQEIPTFKDPVRKGKSKGESIGRARSWHLAALIIGTTNLPIVKIAKLTGIPYRSLRAWNSQTGFKSAKQENAKKFAEFLKDELAKKRLSVDDVHPDFHLYSGDVRAVMPQISYGVLIMPKIVASGTLLNYDGFINEETPKCLKLLEKPILRGEEKKRIAELLRAVMIVRKLKNV
ncbi:MAG: hypothetical protein HQK97_06295, partial [Nitrospirae bacterium]|nr:hypothetical protein [Nitrospirota bacterium]